MKISVIFPSRNRAKQAYDTFWNWRGKSDLKNEIEYILCWDEDACEEYYREFFYEDSIISICLRPNKSAIEAINEGAKIATGDLFVIISDDTDCPENWDTLLLEALEGKSDFCAKTDDGLQPTLITMPIMDRTYYERYGYVYYNGYSHMFCDQELTAVALMTGKYIKLPLKFEHLHYSTGKSPKDEINVKNDLTWKQGENLFNERLKTNFGITEPIMAYSDIKWR
jgi:hypothetical protein